MAKIKMKKSVTLSETFHDFLTAKKVAGASEKTLLTYGQHFSAISKHLCTLSVFWPGIFIDGLARHRVAARRIPALPTAIGALSQAALAVCSFLTETYYYTALLLSGKLNRHLSEIGTQAEAMFSQLVEQMAEQEGITEQLKAENQIEWVRRMNSVRNRVTEVINTELIFT